MASSAKSYVPLRKTEDTTISTSYSPLEISEIYSDEESRLNVPLKHGGVIYRVQQWLLKLQQYVYPELTIKELQMLSLENIALPLTYLMVGTMQGVSSGVMTMYLLRIGATEAQQATILSLQSLPGSFKVFFGFISDTFPLFGYRRKVYMALVPLAYFLIKRYQELPCCISYLQWGFGLQM